MNDSRVNVLGLFAGLGSHGGGVSVSAHVAWDGVTSVLKQYQGHAQSICYGRLPDIEESTTSNTISVSSKPQAILEALSSRWNPDLILVWHIGLLKLLPFLRAPADRTVLFLHGIEAWRQHGILTRFLLRRVDLFISNSDYTWDRTLTWSPWLADRLHDTVHLGVGSSIGVQPPAPTHPPAALMLGRMLRSEDYKGHRELIQAWPSVLQRIPDARLWIAGKGDLRSDLEHVVEERGLDSHVRFWGWVSEEQKQELLTRCHCFAMPSRGEGFGLVYLEAMRLGRPCLVSTLDAGREVVSPPEAGLAVDPRDTKALADAVCRLLTPGPEWDRWSRQARQRYETHFTARHFQERLVSALFESGA